MLSLTLDFSILLQISQTHRAKITKFDNYESHSAYSPISYMITRFAASKISLITLLHISQSFANA